MVVTLPRAAFCALSVAIAIVIHVNVSGHQAIVTRTAELAPLQMGYSDLFRVIERTRQQIDTANAGIERRFESEHLEASAGSTAVSLPRGFQQTDLLGAPERGTDVYYRYSLLDAPIQQVSFRFSDSFRTVVVSGTARSQVDAVFALIREDLAEHAVAMAGSSFRLLAGMILCFVGWAAMGTASSEGLSLSRRVRTVLLAAGISLNLLVVFGPWKAWLPGTAIYLGSPSVLVRYGPEISVTGLIMPVVIWGVRRVAAKLSRPRRPAR